MLKKGLCLLIVAVMLLSFSACRQASSGMNEAAFLELLVAAGDDRADKEDIFEFVQENEAELLAAIQKNDFSEFENQGFIQDIDADETVVDFYCGGVGMGGNTSYVGFFYTPQDDMCAVWCAPHYYTVPVLTPSGSGYAWHEAGGDNTYYTEHICGHFYYYEASF